MTIGIVRTFWSGTSGGPGLTQLAIAANPAVTWTGAEAQSAVNAVRAFWADISDRLPNELTLTVSPTVDQYDEVSGQLTASTVAATAPPTVTGLGTGVYAAGAGGKLVWNTNAIVAGKRVRGATYIVPLDGAQYANDGTIGSTCRTDVNTAASTLIAALTTADLFLNVWSRPTTKDSNDGVRTAVVTGSMNTKTAILRGRRD